jgi:hypothetical protein
MMTKECTCKNGKKNPKCSACAEGDVNLDSFHRLNPEADPRKKTAEQFKIAAKAKAPAPKPVGLWGSMDPKTKERVLGAGKAALTSAVVPGAVAALGAGLTADPGQGWEDAAKAGLVAGTVGGLAGAGHHMGMTGKSELAHSYQRGIGGDIRNMGNWGREQMGQPLLKHPNTPPPPVPPAEVPVPNVVPEAPKAAMFYEFGKIAAIAAFSL